MKIGKDLVEKCQVKYILLVLLSNLFRNLGELLQKGIKYSYKEKKNSVLILLCSNLNLALIFCFSNHPSPNKLPINILLNIGFKESSINLSIKSLFKYKIWTISYQEINLFLDFYV